MRYRPWTLYAWTAAALLAGLPLCAGQEVFEVSGKILQSDGRPFPRALPVLFLDSATSPLALRTTADRTGGFRFKEVPAGTYTFIAHIPLEGEFRKTVEVGPSFADSKRRITFEVRVERLDSKDVGHVVAAAELAVSADAKREYLKALSLLERNDVEGAVASLQKAVRIAPEFVEGWNHLGTIAYTTRKYAQAEKYFRTALEHDPGAYSPTVNLGAALLAMGRTDESLDLNRQAVRMRPDDPLAQSQLGMSYYFLARYDEAISSLKQAKALDPDHFTLPQLFLAAILEREDNLPGAIEELEDFLRHHPDSERAPSVRKQIEVLRARAEEPKEPSPQLRSCREIHSRGAELTENNTLASASRCRSLVRGFVFSASPRWVLDSFAPSCRRGYRRPAGSRPIAVRQQHPVRGRRRSVRIAAPGNRSPHRLPKQG